MGYDMNIRRRSDNSEVILSYAHHIRGGMYAVGGSERTDFYTTYNYAPHFYKYIDENDGIRWIYDKPLDVVVNRLKEVIEAMGDVEPSSDYWEGTLGNAKRALEEIVGISELVIKEYNKPEEYYWMGD